MTNKNEISFWEFLKENKIVIPKIQRDYAQGRQGKEYLRSSFLTKLKDALDGKFPESEQNLKLDFVYGAKEGEISNPLDGQQRLTTLWLLHWFIAYKAGKLNDNNENKKGEINDNNENINEICKTLLKFSYETRNSSRDFCEALILNGSNLEIHYLADISKKLDAINITEIKNYIKNKNEITQKPDDLIENILSQISDKDINEKNLNKAKDSILRRDFVSNLIQNQTWFYSGWKQDPTVQGMLRMLGGSYVPTGDSSDIIDGLEEIFIETTPDKYKNYWNKLTDTENPTILFYHLPMRDFGLSDDLYIKMNARGKPLSDFENLKADLIGYISDKANETKDEKWSDLLKPEEEDKEDKPYSKNENPKGFPYKFDNKWMDIFWESRFKLKEQKFEDKQGDIDEIFYAFINRVFWSELILAKNKDKDIVNFENNDSTSNISFLYLNERKDNKDNPLPPYEGLNIYKFMAGDNETANREIGYEVFKDLITILDRYDSKIDAFFKTIWNKGKEDSKEHDTEKIESNAKDTKDKDNPSGNKKIDNSKESDTDNAETNTNIISDEDSQSGNNEYDFYFIPRYVRVGVKNQRTNKDSEDWSITSISQRGRILFYAVYKYLKDEKFDEQSFKEWMRVVINLISGIDESGRPEIRTNQSMRSAIEFIDTLDSHNVYKSLKNIYDGIRIYEEIKDSYLIKDRNLKPKRIDKYQNNLKDKILDNSQIEESELKKEIIQLMSNDNVEVDDSKKLIEFNKLKEKIKEFAITSAFNRRKKEEAEKAIKILSISGIENEILELEKDIKDLENIPTFHHSIKFLYHDKDGKPDWDNFKKKCEVAKNYFKKDSSQVDELETLRKYFSLIKNYENIKDIIIFNNGKPAWLNLFLNEKLNSFTDEFFLGGIKEDNKQDWPINDVIRFLKIEEKQRHFSKITLRKEENSELFYLLPKNSWKTNNALYLNYTRRDKFLNSGKISVVDNIQIKGDDNENKFFIGENIQFEFEGEKFEWSIDGKIYHVINDKKEPNPIDSSKVEDIEDAIKELVTTKESSANK